MPDSNTPDRQGDITPVGESIVLHGPITESERKEKEREEYQKERDRQENAYKERHNRINAGQLETNRRIAFYTFLLAVLTALGTFVSFLGTQAAKESAQAATVAANAAMDSVRVALIGLDWSHLTYENDTIEKRSALRATIEATKLDQKAWLAVEQPSITIRNGSTFCRITIKNSGKTPATITSSILGCDAQRSFFSYHGTSSRLLPSAVYPGVPVSIEMVGTEIDNSKSDSISSGELRLYSYGTINYQDMWGSPHPLRFCTVKGEADAECSAYNK